MKTKIFAVTNIEEDGNTTQRRCLLGEYSNETVDKIMLRISFLNYCQKLTETLQNIFGNIGVVKDEKGYITEIQTPQGIIKLSLKNEQ